MRAAFSDSLLEQEVERFFRVGIVLSAQFGVHLRVQHRMAHAGFAQQARQVAAPTAVHFIHDDVFIGKKSADAVKVNWDALVVIAIVFNPAHVLVQRVKTGHKPTRFGAIQVSDAPTLVFQLQFVDAKRDEIRHVGGRRVPQTGVKLYPLPFRRVVAGSGDN